MKSFPKGQKDLKPEPEPDEEGEFSMKKTMGREWREKKRERRREWRERKKRESEERERVEN